MLQTAEEDLLSPSKFPPNLKTGGDHHVTPDSRQHDRNHGRRRQQPGRPGLHAEYIEDLPYTGEVMSLSLRTGRPGHSGQIEFLHRLEDKITYYRALHDHTDLWVSLDGGAVDGDSVFPVALRCCVRHNHFDEDDLSALSRQLILKARGGTPPFFLCLPKEKKAKKKHLTPRLGLRCADFPALLGQNRRCRNSRSAIAQTCTLLVLETTAMLGGPAST